MPPSSPEHAREQAARAIASARAICVLTGAGVSAESGLRTFRGASVNDLPEELRSSMAALWKEFDPATLATPMAFEANPAFVTKWYDWRRRGCLAAEPNPAHHALAHLQDWCDHHAVAFTLLTQNVDRLHQRAGSHDVVELHGSIIQWRCTRTGFVCTPPPEPFAQYPLPSVHEGLLRPDVVWFGEPLPEAAVEAAHDAASSCDLFLTIGTSAVVYPAAGFLHLAKRRGATTIEVNPDQTDASDLADLIVRERSGLALPDIVRRLAHTA
jgi:NAD-dependent SIR2 family protein deacetylase